MRTEIIIKKCSIKSPSLQCQTRWISSARQDDYSLRMPVQTFGSQILGGGGIKPSKSWRIVWEMNVSPPVPLQGFANEMVSSGWSSQFRVPEDRFIAGASS